MNFALCGMMGCGKTTVGKLLAKLTDKTFVDTDACIVEKYGVISEIFACHGEAYFRDLETETVAELVVRDDLVIATGGGLVLREKNVAMLKETGKLVYLRTTADTLVQRLERDTERPLLHGGEETLRARIERILGERAKIYEKSADFTVDTDGKSAQEIADEILRIISK